MDASAHGTGAKIVSCCGHDSVIMSQANVKNHLRRTEVYVLRKECASRFQTDKVDWVHVRPFVGASQGPLWQQGIVFGAISRLLALASWEISEK